MDKGVIVLIPSYQPTEKLKLIIEEITKKFRVILVDDGSGEKYEKYFKELSYLEENGKIVIIKHDENLGKGSALKSGLLYYKQKLFDTGGIVTADSDGQHTAKDIEKISQSLKDGFIVMGVRNFEQKNVPLKSKVGNKLTRLICSIFFGITTKDTQTGLRGFKKEMVDTLLSIKGQRFEYELNVLLDSRIKTFDVDIETVYLEENKGSHFRPIIDSLKVYSVFFKFCISGIVSFSLDFVIFLLGVKFGLGLVKSNIFSKLLSSLVNFQLNKKIVFKVEEKTSSLLLKYYLLFVMATILSTILINIFEKTGFELKNSKICSEILVFFINYYAQKIYSKNKNKKY